jgi:hypothetical protein
LPLSTAAAEINFTGKVLQIFNYEAHSGPLLQIDNMLPTLGLCARNDFYILPVTHKYYKENRELILAAKLANKTLLVLVDSSPATCVEGFNRIKHLSITD